MAPSHPILRSMLFAPANRRDLVEKFARTGTDAGILDLEDGVAPSGKDDARHAAATLVPELSRQFPSLPLYVRVNAPTSPWFADDLSRALTPELTGVVIAKLETPAELDAVLAGLKRRELSHLKIVAGIETAAGVGNIEQLLREPVSACYFGAEDYIADMGGRRTRASLESLFARSKVALAARLANVVALDQVVVEIRDDERFIEDAELGRAIGYQGKICIHPAQVSLSNACFSPTPEEVDRSRRLLALHDEAAREGMGVVEFEGQMVDGPLVRMAEHAIAIADAIAARSD